jgi:hypothetical protein
MEPGTTRFQPATRIGSRHRPPALVPAFGLRIENGEVVWHSPAPHVERGSEVALGCSGARAAAATAIPGSSAISIRIASHYRERSTGERRWRSASTEHERGEIAFTSLTRLGPGIPSSNSRTAVSHPSFCTTRKHRWCARNCISGLSADPARVRLLSLRPSLRVGALHVERAAGCYR